jgi:cytochrome b561
MAHKTGYSIAQIALHWITAFLIVAAFFLSDGMGDALRERVQNGATGTDGNTSHVWIGGAVFAVVLLRLVVRMATGIPPAPDGTPQNWEMAAVWGHRLLYALMIMVPLSGAATWYGGFKLGQVHEWAGTGLMVAAGGHVVAAMLHEAMRGDGTMARMFRPAK